MKKTPLLHGELSHLVATLGHGDSVVIADAGLPVPAGTRCIDVALSRGVPSFEQVLDALLSEMLVQRADYAVEMSTHNPRLETVLHERLGDAALQSIGHDALKQRSGMARAVVRTGECTPYANVILYAGVVF